MANKLISKARLGFLVNVIILEVVKSGERTLAWDVIEQKRARR
jgi:hypothetical protein